MFSFKPITQIFVVFNVVCKYVPVKHSYPESSQSDWSCRVLVLLQWHSFSWSKNEPIVRIRRINRINYTHFSLVQQGCKVLENVKGLLAIHKTPIKIIMSIRKLKVTLTTTTADEPVKNCLYCNNPSHKISRCSRQKLTSGIHKEFVTFKPLCFSCLSTSHMKPSCQSKEIC